MGDSPSILHIDIDRLRYDAELVYSRLVHGRDISPPATFDQTLYAYVMMAFAHIDRASSVWAGSEKEQTKRMVNFMTHYMRSDREANNVAVQLWRHKLMHTARPRQLRHPKTGKTYYWLLHWAGELPVEQHWTFNDSDDRRIFAMGLMCLLADLQSAIRAYLSDLDANPELKGKFSKVQNRMLRYEFRL
jgi:hypothetical protein